MPPKDLTPSLATAIHDPGAQYLDQFLSLSALRERFSTIACNVTQESDSQWLSALEASGVPYRTAPANLDHIGSHRLAALSICPIEYPVLYADPDHILRWLSADAPGLDAIAANNRFDCLIIGRTQAGFFETPRRLRETETVVNSLFQVATGLEADLMMACRRFTPQALKMVRAGAEERSIGNDVEWPLLCHQAGLSVGSCTTDGLTYKTIEAWVNRQPDGLDYDLDAWLTRTQFLQQHVAVFERMRR